MTMNQNQQDVKSAWIPTDTTSSETDGWLKVLDELIESITEKKGITNE